MEKMNDKQLLELLKNDVNKFNQYREENPQQEIDFSHEDLSGADLFGADLNGVDLIGADLRGANLIWADLGGANMAFMKALSNDKEMIIRAMRISWYKE